VKRTWRSRVENKLMSRRSVARNDEEAVPTNPLGGKLEIRPLVQENDILSQSRIQNPSVRQATPVPADALTEQRLVRGLQRIGRKSANTERLRPPRPHRI